MQLVFLYGPPGVGKLTVARELAALTRYRLFHNHLTVDLVGSVFDFGSEPFVELRERIWLDVFREAAQRGVSLIFTYAPEATVRGRFIGDALDAVRAHGGDVFWVELTCAPGELERRIEDPSRAAFGKLRSPALVRELRGRGALDGPRPAAPDLAIDTTDRSPRETAALIRSRLPLPG